MAYGKQHPEPGDLIEIKRQLYQHWALYLGDGYVLNVTPVDEGAPSLLVSTASIFTRKAKVKKQLLKEVVGNNDWEVNNKYDRSRTPLPVKEIIKRAESYIDAEVTYDVLGKNCEHFVTMLRYGESVSDQAKIAIGSMLALGAAAVVSTVLVGLLRGRSREKEY
ncbi:PREDICTED: phospholipid-metabolizing enzyme A-C1-like [Lepidothrix coronata]|uniref:Phospholipid-metabolizing enzyme A-C1-like n=1 Tax=Lepidothrix coronata TaxID=321398 RepID=A0A6J0GWC5_9PASS|nr:PREDICTED: phospholipid-metabolizing enzyme A-C1-like [Lepidothrix coronata]